MCINNFFKLNRDRNRLQKILGHYSKWQHVWKYAFTRTHLPYFTSERDRSYSRNFLRGQKSNHARAYLPYFSLERNAHSWIGVKSLRAGWNGQIGSVWLLWKIGPFLVFSIFARSYLWYSLKKVVIRAYA